MSEVGSLIIRLQAETAQFKDDLGKVKSELKDLGDSGADAGSRMDGGFTQARYGMMLTEETIGVRLPRALNTLLAQIPAVGAAFSLMLPLAGVAAAIAIIVKLVEKHKEAEIAARNLALAQEAMGTVVETTFTKLDDKLLEAGIKADELSGNHLDALKKQLQLIDHQSLQELVQEFGIVAAAADKTFSAITEHWYESKIGVAGVKDALETFKTQYASLLAQNRNKEATDLLAGTLESAQKMKELMQAQQNGHGSTQSDLDALTALVGALQAQVTIEEKIVALKKAQDQAATQKVDNELAVDSDKRFKTEADSAEKEANRAEQAWKKAYEDAVADLDESEKEKIVATREGTQARIAAIDAAIKEENSKGLQHTSYYRSLEEQKVVAVKAAADEEVKIEASKTKLTEALEKEHESSLLNSLKAEEAANDSAHSLGIESETAYVQQRIQLIKEEQAIKAAAIQAEIADQNKLAATEGAAGNIEAQNNALTKAVQLQTQLNQVTAQYKSELVSVETEAAKLQANWGTYFAKMKAETLDLSTQIRTTLQSAVTQFTNSFSSSIAKSIVESKNLGQAVRQEAGQILESMLSAILKWGIQWLLTHTIMRAAAATTASTQIATATATTATEKALAASLAGANAIASFSLAPYPIDMGAPAFGASMMAAAMSFEVGGKIPGAGAVPIVGHGGETVVTKALTDRVEQSEGRGHSITQGDTHVHMQYAPSYSGMDAASVEGMMKTHMGTFRKMLTSELRKLNR